METSNNSWVWGKGFGVTHSLELVVSLRNASLRGFICKPLSHQLGRPCVLHRIIVHLAGCQSNFEAFVLEEYCYDSCSVYQIHWGGICTHLWWQEQTVYENFRAYFEAVKLLCGNSCLCSIPPPTSLNFAALWVSYIMKHNICKWVE